MDIIIKELISAVLQITVFALVPFIFFLFRKDRNERFFGYIGLYGAPLNSIMLVLLAGILMIAAGISVSFISSGFREVLYSPNSVTGKLHAMGLSPVSVAVLLITALLKTSLSEEILFRGFIAKRLIKKFGYNTGNILQSVIFGIVHLLLFYFIAKSDVGAAIFIFIFSSAAGYIICYIKEKYAEGSIIPGWVAHGLGNTVSYFIIAFVI